jgi:hypothetical protein
MTATQPTDSNLFQINAWNAIQSTPAPPATTSQNRDRIPPDFLLIFDHPGQSKPLSPPQFQAPSDINDEPASSTSRKYTLFLILTLRAAKSAPFGIHSAFTVRRDPKNE